MTTAVPASISSEASRSTRSTSIGLTAISTTSARRTSSALSATCCTPSRSARRAARPEPRSVTRTRSPSAGSARSQPSIMAPAMLPAPIEPRTVVSLTRRMVLAGDSPERRPAATLRRMSTPTATGRCLCGAVSYELHGELRGVLVCHCVECRRYHGTAGAYTAVAREGLTLHDSEDLLRWFPGPQSATGGERGFCSPLRLEPALAEPGEADVLGRGGHARRATGLRSSSTSAGAGSSWTMGCSGSRGAYRVLMGCGLRASWSHASCVPCIEQGAISLELGSSSQRLYEGEKPRNRHTFGTLSRVGRGSVRTYVRPTGGDGRSGAGA